MGAAAAANALCVSADVSGGGVTSVEAEGDKAFASALAVGNPPADSPPGFTSRAIRVNRSTEVSPRPPWLAELVDRL